MMTSTELKPLQKESLSAVVASSNPQFRRHILSKLISRSWLAEEARGGAEALAMMEGGDQHALLLDRRLPDLDVNELVGLVRDRYPHTEVFVLDSDSGKPTVVHDLTLSPHRSELFRLLQNSREPRIPAKTPILQHDETGEQKVEKPEPDPLPGMIGRSESLRRVFRLARLIAPRTTTVLLTGETGTGKELVARAIHDLGRRGHRPFVVVNCAALPEALVEAELFGYNRGAFTGAFQSYLGRFHTAQGGTVLLDEVGDLPLSMQAKLLRFLQEGELQRLGSSQAIRVDVRVIAATNADLDQLVAEGHFREDLYYRLAVFPIELDPLRLRRDDIAPLSAHYLAEFCREAQAPLKTLSPQATQVLEAYAWPGNVRELKQVIERAFIVSEESPEIRSEHLSVGRSGRECERNLRNKA
jgi:transcriptional regulator with GAF, ATPase, and Fis domain